MQARILLEKLKKKFGLYTDKDLANRTGISTATIQQWKAKENGITETIVANLLHKAVERGGEIALQNGIQPIVEFYPIDCAESKRGAKWEILPSNSHENPYESQLKAELRKSKGIYIFYNSTGHALYAGKTLNQDLWKEINLAFNRTRSAQRAFLVNHPSKGNFIPAHEKSRKLAEQSVYLHDIATYFSAYCVHESLINNLEAFLIRAFPNDLSNVRMENFNRAE